MHAATASPVGTSSSGHKRITSFFLARIGQGWRPGATAIHADTSPPAAAVGLGCESFSTGLPS